MKFLKIFYLETVLQLTVLVWIYSLYLSTNKLPCNLQCECEYEYYEILETFQLTTCNVSVNMKFLKLFNLQTLLQLAMWMWIWNSWNFSTYQLFCDLQCECEYEILETFQLTNFPATCNVNAKMRFLKLFNLQTSLQLAMWMWIWNSWIFSTYTLHCNLQCECECEILGTFQLTNSFATCDVTVNIIVFKLFNFVSGWPIIDVQFLNQD